MAPTPLAPTVPIDSLPPYRVTSSNARQRSNSALIVSFEIDILFLTSCKRIRSTCISANTKGTKITLYVSMLAIYTRQGSGKSTRTAAQCSALDKVENIDGCCLSNVTRKRRSRRPNQTPWSGQNRFIDSSAQYIHKYPTNQSACDWAQF
jgi:hypothetical protein